METIQLKQFNEFPNEIEDLAKMSKEDKIQFLFSIVRMRTKKYDISKSLTLPYDNIKNLVLASLEDVEHSFVFIMDLLLSTITLIFHVSADGFLKNYDYNTVALKFQLKYVRTLRLKLMGN